MVDKNLFLYDLAVVAILKDEAPYLAEWLDYHLAAGVEHFYLYDNAGTDNQAEVARPYVEAGLVDYFPAPGELMQMPAYNDAVKKFRFVCRSMAFIDADEFLYPKTDRSVAEVVDEIFALDSKAAGVAVNWQIFGSSGHETADLSRGVLERFTRRAPSDWAPDGLGNAHVKTVSNPRKINLIHNPHFAQYFINRYSVNENGKQIPGEIIHAFNNPVTVDKIALNHYYNKSREEFANKIRRGRCDNPTNNYKMAFFDACDRNEIFDDGILRYRAARAKNFALENNDDRVIRVINTLTATLPTVSDMETALTCRAISSYLRGKLSDDRFKDCEEASIAAALMSLNDCTYADAQMFIRELPELLTLPYPIVADVRRAAENIISQLMDVLKRNVRWHEYAEYNFIRDMLKIGG